MKKFNREHPFRLVVRERRAERPRTHPSPSHDDDEDGEHLFNTRDATRGRADGARDDEDA